MTSSVEIGRLFDFCDLHVSRWRTLPVTQGFISRPMYYDRQGFAIPADGPVPAPIMWARLLEQHGREYQRVAWDELPDGSQLSTVWIGLDHAVMGPPLIFETMRFARDVTESQWTLGGRVSTFTSHATLTFPDPLGEPDEETEQLRYTTEEEALAAHHEIRRRLVLRLGS